MAKQSSFNNDDNSPLPTALKSSQVSEENNAYEQKYSPPLPTMAGNSNSFDEKVLSPSNGAFEQSLLEPCEICGRTFNSKALERHIKVCEKVATKKPTKAELSEHERKEKRKPHDWAANMLLVATAVQQIQNTGSINGL